MNSRLHFRSAMWYVCFVRRQVCFCLLPSLFSPNASIFTKNTSGCEWIGWYVLRYHWFVEWVVEEKPLCACSSNYLNVVIMASHRENLLKQFINVCSKVLISFFAILNLYSCFEISVNYSSFSLNFGHAVAHLVEALCYKPEGHGLNSRWGHWIF
jgi:hypothetical protein